MAYLKLISLYCRTTEDAGGADECYLMINGLKAWNGDLNDQQSADLRGVAKKQFNGTCRIELFDEDTGIFDSDDKLGSATVSDSAIGSGTQPVDFTDDGASYTLTYEVVDDSIGTTGPILNVQSMGTISPKFAARQVAIENASEFTTSMLVLNHKTKEIHHTSCAHIKKMASPGSREVSNSELLELIRDGYDGCSDCNSYLNYK